MKYSLIIPALLISAHAMAASVPTALPDGKYSMECQQVSVIKYDPVSDRETLAGTDSNGITRRVTKEKGTRLIITSGDMTMIKDVYSSQSDTFSGVGEDVIQKRLKTLA